MDLKQIKGKELLRFLVGGSSAVLVDFATYRMLVHFGMDMSVSKAISYIAGAMVGFVINKFWTFECKQLSVIEILRYILLYACSALANTAVNAIVMWVTSITVFSFLCATGVSTIMNFLGQKFYVFKSNAK